MIGEGQHLFFLALRNVTQLPFFRSSPSTVKFSTTEPVLVAGGGSEGENAVVVVSGGKDIGSFSRAGVEPVHFAAEFYTGCPGSDRGEHCLIVDNRLGEGGAVTIGADQH